MRWMIRGFGDWFQRKENEAALRAIIEDALASADAKTWEKRLNDAGAPCASIWRIEEVIDHPQIAARDAVQTVETEYGPLRLMGSGLPDGAWRRQAGPRAAAAGRAHRRGAGRGWLLRR